MPRDAQRRLNDGNRAFADLFAHLDSRPAPSRRVIPIDARDLGLASGGTVAPAQRPYAAVLGCADARVPIELIFNEGPNDLFVVRVAGNTLGDDVRGSLKYALEHLGDSLKLIVVLGHSAAAPSPRRWMSSSIPRATFASRRSTRCAGWSIACRWWCTRRPAARSRVRTDVAGDPAIARR